MAMKLILDARSATLASVCLFLGGIFTMQAQTWGPSDAPSLNWAGLAASSNGMKMVAVSGQGTPGGIYTSIDGGLSWTKRKQINGNWRSIASSADGTRLVAATFPYLYVSGDSGVTWTPSGAPLADWTAVASSGDGRRLAACGWAEGYGFPQQPGALYVSSDFGSNWTKTTAPVRFWTGIVSSSDGSKIAAICEDVAVYTSSNGGATWVSNGVRMASTLKCLATIADGSRMLAGDENGSLCSSTNSGQTWSAPLFTVIFGPPGYLESISISADGSKVVMAATNALYVRKTSGYKTAATEIPVNWSAVTVSADGSRMAAATMGGTIYVSPAPPQHLNASFSDKVICLDWPSSAGFVLQQNTNLLSTNWVTVTNSASVTNQRALITLPRSDGQMFYRMRSLD